MGASGTVGWRRGAMKLARERSDGVRSSVCPDSRTAAPPGSACSIASSIVRGATRRASTCTAKLAALLPPAGDATLGAAASPLPTLDRIDAGFGQR